jgi:small subunit ribosomal protein S14
MIKKSTLQSHLKKKNLVKKYLLKREVLLQQLKKATNLDLIFLLQQKLQKFPRNSIKIRLRNRCWKTGKARGYYRFFGLCRNAFRELALDCYLPGIIKSSW